MSILTWDDSALPYTTIKLTRISIAITRDDEDMTWTTGYYKQSTCWDQVISWGGYWWLETIGYYTTINWQGLLQGQRICQWYWRGTTQHHAKVKWDDEAIYNNCTEGDDSASYNKALCNHQFDEAWDGTRGIIMPRIGQQSLTQQSLDEEEGYCEAEWHVGRIDNKVWCLCIMQH